MITLLQKGVFGAFVWLSSTRIILPELYQSFTDVINSMDRLRIAGEGVRSENLKHLKESCYQHRNRLQRDIMPIVLHLEGY